MFANVQGYMDLGQHYSLKVKNQDEEIQRRIMAGWAAYAKHRDIFKSNLAICLQTTSNCEFAKQQKNVFHKISLSPPPNKTPLSTKHSI